MKTKTPQDSGWARIITKPNFTTLKLMLSELWTPLIVPRTLSSTPCRIWLLLKSAIQSPGQSRICWWDRNVSKDWGVVYLYQIEPTQSWRSNARSEQGDGPTITTWGTHIGFIVLEKCIRLIGDRWLMKWILNGFNQYFWGVVRWSRCEHRTKTKDQTNDFPQETK